MEPAVLQLKGTAFFPVGRGLVQAGDCTLQDKQVMVLGQDFGTVAYLQQRLLKGRDNEVDSTTWRELCDLLPEAGIPLQACFFTNAYMGLRKEGPMVGALPAGKNSAYRIWCERFWRLQFRGQRPTLLVVLGKEPARFLGRIVPELAAWDSARTYADLQQREETILPFDFEGRPGLAVTIPHPSFLHANAGRCRWRGETGRRALEAMLREAFQLATSKNAL